MSETQEYTLQPGSWGVGGGVWRDDRPVRFNGRQLVTWSSGGRDATRRTTWTVYATRGGNVVVAQEYHTLWEGEVNSLRVAVFATLADVPDVGPGQDGIGIPDNVRVLAEQALGYDPAIVVE